MAVRILTDDDVQQQMTMNEAIEVMARSFRQHATGALVAPARLAIPLDLGQLVFTAGSAAATDQLPGRIGFRVYDTAHFGSDHRDELVAVFDIADGSLQGVVVGQALGPLRTGAIGGVAIDTLARADAASLALVGTGGQARTQLIAACAVRRFTSIRAFSRTEATRDTFCREMSELVELEIQPAATSREAVESADVVICSTVSQTPVLEREWIAPGTHVQNVGPKFRDDSELPVSLYEQAEVLVTDAPAQLDDYGTRFLVANTPHAGRIVPLGEVVAGKVPGRTADDQISLFCSLGLAGTEVTLADELLRRVPAT
ncbi:MAG: hypothetical protein QF363_11395 [Planctomycetaceae bacterium]|jgi:ornithine cyclodeaminase|nr:hypothetical protein [Planctomycetaceae bacterium]